jgi:hypothetical protein
MIFECFSIASVVLGGIPAAFAERLAVSKSLVNGR